jgi:2-C-methyl-D-erythritol 2,4-cyclodiphosphate synthase
MRIGHGYDAHRFTEGRPLVIGGVDVPFDRGLAAHSDGDVLIHAVCDAVLGALGLGDIGKHFPDTNDAYAGIDSRILLGKVAASMRTGGYSLGNLDVTLIAQVPKMAPFISNMVGNLAADLGADSKRVNVKATTTERMGFTGREEGIACHAVCILEQAS